MQRYKVFYPADDDDEVLDEREFCRLKITHVPGRSGVAVQCREDGSVPFSSKRKFDSVKSNNVDSCASDDDDDAGGKSKTGRASPKRHTRGPVKKEQKRRKKALSAYRALR